VSFAVLSLFILLQEVPVASTPTRNVVITRSGTRSSSKGSTGNFTGSVSIEPIFAATEKTKASAGSVTFEAGARSAWHTHPAGQTLIVTAGTGWVQEWGGERHEIRAGDVIWTPPGVKHWHGATATERMTHLAIQEHVNGKVVEWLEHVTDAEYGAPLTTSGLRIQQPNVAARRISPAVVESVAPALERATQERLYGEVWTRPGLSRRDRSLVTVAAMIARGETGALTYYFDQAFENGVSAAELSETITHLAYYSGWGRAMGAVAPAHEVFTRRGIGPQQLPSAVASLLPLDEAAEGLRAKTVGGNFREVAPGVVHYTTDALFRELWLRPALAPRDRSLVTLSALIASGQVAQITYHLGRAMDHGLTKEQASEVLTQLAFYAGWPCVFSALPVVKDVIEKRAP
jgi:4-carboxymuconolactone decarboxylase